MKNLLYPPGIFRKFINRGLILKGSLCFLFFVSLKPLSNKEILELSMNRFNINMPGFQTVLQTRSFGKWFELETALCIQDFYNEDILGFNLDINISDTLKNQTVEIYIPGSKVRLHTTEYDVITKNYVFECKSGKISAKRIKISQFSKERNLIEWFKVIKREVILGSISFRTEFSRKGRLIFVINGLSTLGKDVCLTSSWINCLDLENFCNYWFEIIELLSTKNLRLAFKRTSSEHISSLLQRNNFIFEENFSYERCYGS